MKKKKTLTLKQQLRVIERVKGLMRAGWMQYSLACDAKGRDCSPLSKKAVNRCVLGGFKAASRTRSDSPPLFDAFSHYVLTETGRSAVGMNDSYDTKKRTILKHLTGFARQLVRDAKAARKAKSRS